ncbi:MAG: 16S rRNA (guanine(966)-N(2))-methyltransferase RsmD [Candidatus Phytoplasma stylosanthis]|uniref:16S rRNA (guanine(966)-N(2))-methyltransferase RsmD n=1 Tax=Candidatus Phytoplasma stylosanthis TaxID=2798314 RepID=UPI00293A4324|nr:16S rRNA (guanine(966)-N(2))-methyltransferase RsmD [Candidatus Phytoplasma stylosanthis]MDV3167944.1 16S rRNA (guanine(966)-N(2))-methyltransferase RsmD [Candidatus Phytoplasma stylosanthis]MDV3173625.1 16S rRNA (guanine(966)-N(2))-methyltransferase RsmD [Candidatus Phytoplasma stylosanthis]MDV3174241.1 16S rRNA (guanine(966)-N(2))-methyltransferase RsmD [Candidatus Phytoplasma stylosanthis]
MLRIISGKYKGFKLNSVLSDQTRSTSHLLRKSLFDTIGKFIEESIVLDLFAGSGACGFEALSRKAKKIYLVDHSFLAFNIINKNKNKLKLDKKKVQIFCSDAFKMLRKFIKQNLFFDLVILDPPYFFNFYISIFKNLEKITHEKSLIVLEIHYKTLLSSEINSFYLFKKKIFGTRKIYFYKKKFF